MQPLLLGISGSLGSGKDTAFGFIQEWAEGRGLTAARSGFADKLKISAATALGIEGDADRLIDVMNKLKLEGHVHVYWDEEPGEERGVRITGRKFLQLYGTEAHREVFGSSFWTDALLPLTGQRKIGVNEAEWINDIRGLDDDEVQAFWPLNFWTTDNSNPDICVITDVRFDNEAERVRELGGQLIKIDRQTEKTEASAHASEAGISIYDHGLLNDKGLDLLRERVFDLMTYIWENDE